METRCYGCMQLKHQPVCEHCGYDERRGNELHQLPLGTVLRGQYVIGRVLGQGGFGITYLGWDRSLEEPVAIKEYFPNGQVSRNASRAATLECTTAGQSFAEGRDRFLNEARTLAKLRKVGSIVQVMNFFLENNTAYIVMEYVEGITLQAYMAQRGGRLTAPEAFAILQPVLKALHRVHEAGMIHRDISPDNIMLQNDGTVKLLDFGTARDLDKTGGLAHSTQAVLKHGFAPMEQYSSGRAIDRRADEYALGATVWCCLTGRVPPDAPSMIMDGTQIDWSGIPGLTEQQRKALEKATAFRVEERFPNLLALHEALFGVAPEYTAWEEETIRKSLFPEMPAPAPGVFPETLPMQGIPNPAPGVFPGTLPMQDIPNPNPAAFPGTLPMQDIPNPAPGVFPGTLPMQGIPNPNPGAFPGTLPMQGIPNPNPGAFPGTLPMQESPVPPIHIPDPMGGAVPFRPGQNGPQYPPLQEQPASEGGKRKLSWKMIAAIVAVVFLVVYSSCYVTAKGNARDGKFQEAEDVLFAPFLTSLHDPQLADYIEAGKKMEKGWYKEANAAFKKLSGYLNADKLEQETAYEYGKSLMELGNYNEADKLFTELVKKKYSGASDMQKENQFRWAKSQIRNGNYVEAYNKLDKIRGYSDVNSELSYLKETMYTKGKSKYASGSYTEAKELFDCISAYSDSGKYLTLIDARSGMGSTQAASTANKLKALIGFEDAAALLVSDTDIACNFLLGQWKTKNGKYYFRIEKVTGKSYDFHSYYNLPWYGGSFEFKDGIYRVTDDGYKDKSQFKFTVVSADTVKIYCYKNKTTYTLYRKS